jgi:hypothetical protein
MTTHSNTALPDEVHTSRPGYSAMRMVAEWASGVRGEQLYFGFDGTHATLTDVTESGTLPMFTRRFAGRPQVQRVHFTVTTTDKARHSLSIDARETSALFWSESAVEKFLFPYFASVAGSEAPQLFAKLARAWYDYPGNDVQVCAVAYECGPAAPFGARKLTLEGLVSLVCLVGGDHLERVALADFDHRFPGPGVPGPVPLQPPAGPFRDEGGWTLSPSVENIVARDAAEFVSGLRGHQVRFRALDGQLDPWVPEDGPGRDVPDPWIETGMERVRIDRPAPSRVVLQVGHSAGDVDVPVVPSPTGTPGDATQVPDSIFWTDGAVEKLLVPYYGSVKGLAAPFVTTMLLGKWNGLIRRGSRLGACAVLEILQNFLDAPADGSDTAQAAADEPVDDNPVAVTHLPRSEYIPNNVDEPPTQALEGRTHFLTLGGGREPLASFLRR